jgi:hypothetical protein
MKKLERVSFFRGQQLKATDLNEVYRVLREMRWLHSRSLHDWGIALGLAVSGQKGDVQVKITSGYAVDRLGRELLSAEAQTKEVPAVAGDALGNPVAYLLVISFPQDKDLVAAARSAGVCAPGGITRLVVPPQIRWLPSTSSSYRHGLDIILAQASVQNCCLARPLSFTLRRSARPASRPYIASGQTDPTKTIWQLLTNPSSANMIGFTTRVDTSAAQFQATPAYQAHIVGRRWQDAEQSIVVVDGCTSIRNATARSFDLAVVTPQGFTTPGGIPLNANLSADTPSTLGWYVVWMGVEGI